MPEILTKVQAIEFLGLDEKTFENYFRNAAEFNCLPREGARGKFRFDKTELQSWLDNYNLRTVELTIDDYALCLDFALAQHFRGYVLSDWGTARQREFGQKITNWVKGQLAEVAVRKFFADQFNFHIELDFEIHDQIVPQDITQVVVGGVKRPPRLGVGIKSSKPKSAYLVLGENEVTLKGRRSDVYILCRPEIPDDHLLRLTRKTIIRVVENQPHYSSYRDMIPSFENILCEIAGYCGRNELEQVTNIPGQEFDGARYVKKSGLLHRSNPDWTRLLARL
jgi:hypothetical protein